MTKTVELSIQGLSCAGCVRSAERALLSVAGVDGASVDLITGSARVEANDDADPGTLVTAIKEAGYDAQMVEEPKTDDDSSDSETDEIELSISGMTCAGCVRSVERALSSVEGVESASVDLVTGGARVHTAGAVEPEALIEAVESAGYGAETVVPEASQMAAGLEKQESVWRTYWVLALSVILTVPLLSQMAFPLIGVEGGIPPLVQLLLALPVQVIAGARFYRGTFNGLKHGQSNMDTLVALGTTAAFGLSLAVMAKPLVATPAELLSAQSSLIHELYFEASATVITLVLLGKLLEERAKKKTNEALEALMKLQPAKALVERGGKQLEIPAAQVRKNDVVVIRPGDSIPVDGVVLSGHSQVDEALLTGESMPISKGEGDSLTGGAINGDGLLKARPTTLGKSSKLNRIIEQVRVARTTKPEIQKLVDQVSAIFVPAVIALAAVTFLGWWLVGGVGLEVAIVNAVAVLVIACPCALGLATPTAIMVGSGQAARLGVLVKDADAIDGLAKATAVVFDKTGTLTVGHPAVIACEAADGNEKILALAGGMTEGSSHPLSKAIRGYVEQQGAEITAIESNKALAGLGITGEAEGRKLYLGSRKLMEQQGASLEALEEKARNQQEGGATLVWLAQSESGQAQVLGFFALKDEIRSSAKQSVEALKRDGLRVMMLSGDQQAAAEAIARQLGIEEVKAELLPEDKLSCLKELHQAGERVVMVGDGINDAPALAGADVGLAMGDGTDVAIRSADASLTRSDPYLVHKAIRTGRLIRRKIAQNLFGAFVYNVIGLPLAALGFLNPVLAGAAMALSSVTVMTSSLTLYSTLKRID